MYHLVTGRKLDPHGIRCTHAISNLNIGSSYSRVMDELHFGQR